MLTKSNSTSQLEAVSKGISYGVVAPPPIVLPGDEHLEHHPYATIESEL